MGPLVREALSRPLMPANIGGIAVMPEISGQHSETTLSCGVMPEEDSPGEHCHGS
jgi:hypothetical protein